MDDSSATVLDVFHASDDEPDAEYDLTGETRPVATNSRWVHAGIET
ncbi:hypothetical protein [Haloarcula amylolytica]|nr:hypothetical protein [Haloarcula amylolytica]